MKLSLKKRVNLLILPMTALLILLLLAVIVPARGIRSYVTALKLDISIAIEAERFSKFINQQTMNCIRTALSGEPADAVQTEEIEKRTRESFLNLKTLIGRQDEEGKRIEEINYLDEVAKIHDRASLLSRGVIKLSSSGSNKEAIDLIIRELNPLVDGILLDKHIKPFMSKKEDEIRDTAASLLEHNQSLNILTFNLLKLYIEEVVTEASILIEGEKFERLLNEQTAEWFIYLISNTKEQGAEIENEAAEAYNGLAAWERLLAVEEGREKTQKIELDVIKDVRAEYLTANMMARRIFDLTDQGSYGKAKELLLNELDPLVNTDLIIKVEHILNRGEEEFKSTMSAMTYIADLLNWGIMGLILLVFGVGVGSPMLLSRSIITPILKIKDAASEIQNGNMDTQIDIDPGNELGELAESFNRMALTLKQSRDELEKLVEARTLELTMSNQKLVQEVTERKRAEQQLLHDAFHDSLTGLPNRALFMDRLAHLLIVAKRRENHPYAVLFLDMDRFKVINDSLGHMVGDKLLVEFGKTLVQCLRPGDTVARFGGDEFAVLLEDTGKVDNIMFITDRIQKELAKPFNVAGHEIFAGASIGIAVNATDYDSPDQILRDADIAMYQAKSRGKARSVIFEPGMHDNAVERLKLETELRKAVERGEFVTYFQPIVSSITNGVIGYEALVRWRHPERGLVFPGDFLDVAEDTGIIVTIDRLVLMEACLQMHKWQMMFPDSSLRFISVNLSNKQMAQPDLVEYVSQVINESGIAPGSLKLEITENVIMENLEATIEKLTRLRALGVQLYIDDFGTGYSSLSYLHRFPINGLKIDRSFIRRIGDKGENHEIIKTIMTLARDMNVDVIAEGVETENQLAQIKSMDCEYWQGYLFFKPVDSEHAEALINTRKVVSDSPEKHNAAFNGSSNTNDTPQACS